MKTYKKLKFVGFSNIESWSAYSILEKRLRFSNKYKLVKIKTFLSRNKTSIKIEDNNYYKRPTIRINGAGISLRDKVKGEKIGTKSQFLIKKGQFLLSKIDARNGAFGVVPEELEGGVITGNFWTFDVNYNVINPYFLQLITKTKQFQDLSQSASVGTTNRNYLQEESFLNFSIPLPSISEQETIVKNYYDKIEQAVAWEQEADALEKKIENYLFEELGVSFQKYELLQIGKLHFIEFKEIENWIYNSIEMQFYKDLSKSKFPINTIGDVFDFISRNWEKKANEDKEYIELGSIDANFGILETKTINPEKAPSRATQIVKTGDLIIGTTRPYLKKFAIIDEKYSDSVASSGFSVIEENKGKYNLYFLNEVIKSDIGIKQFEIKMTGALYPAITQTELESLKIPVPPLSKQNEIAATIATMKQEQKNKIERATLLKQQAEQEFEQTIFS